MSRRPALLALLSLIIVVAVSFNTWAQLTPRGFPLDFQNVDTHTGVIKAKPYHALPPGIQAGDRVDLRQQSMEVRIASVGGSEPLGQVLDLVVQRGTETLHVPVAVVDLGDQPGLSWFAWPPVLDSILLGAIALLLIWRGRDRAAFGMGLWATTFVLSAPVNFIALTGWPSLIAFCLSALLFLTARVGFYIMVEARVGAAMSAGQLRAFRAGFWILLVLGAMSVLGGALLQVFLAWSELRQPRYGLALTASYLVPVAMLFAGYGTAPVAERQRLRWMLMGGVAWTLGILLQNTPVFGGAASAVISNFLLVTAVLAFVYAVLRLRVVDISVAIDRALVYGGVTTLVVGIIAAVNSLALRETLVPGAGLLLQVLVPLALGIVLGKVRAYADRFVERVFFRQKYLSDRALRTFGRRAGHMQDASALLATTVKELHKHTKSPAVALYAPAGGGYAQVAAAGETAYPARLAVDDPAMVAARAEQKTVELAGLESALGDGCLVPLRVLGQLEGVLVLRERPGEHYAADEKKLLLRVARDVAAAWRLLRAREQEAFVRVAAKGTLDLPAIRARAQALEIGTVR